MRMRRGSPFAARRTLVLLVALQAQLSALRWQQFLEAQDRIRLPPARNQVPAGWSVALLARLATMHIMLKGVCISFVARRAELIVVDEFGV
jgi:hypothetical protein